jgi:hypothetical protein
MRATPEDLEHLDEANERFVEESSRFAFQYRCESCAHIKPSSEACSLGYPNHFLVGPVRAIEPDGNLTFCKYFELGEIPYHSDEARG